MHGYYFYMSYYIGIAKFTLNSKYFQVSKINLFLTNLHSLYS